MDAFFPSDIAKAVYGYLVSEGCEDAAKTFLETSPHLEECRKWVQQGRTIPNSKTQLLGHSLVQVLDLALSAYTLVDHLKNNEKRLQSQRGDSTRKLYDEVLRFVSSDALANPSAGADTGQERPVSQVSQPKPVENNIPQLSLHTPPYNEAAAPGKARKTSVADDYQSLVQQSLAEGFDSSLSPDKSQSQRLKTQVSSPSRQRTSSAPGALLSDDSLSFDSALRTQTSNSLLAVTSASSPNPPVTIPVTSLNTQVTSSNTQVTSSNVVTSSSAVSSSCAVSSAVDVPGTSTQCFSVPLPIMNLLPGSYATPITEGAGNLPDPPIILVKSQTEIYHAGSQQGVSFYGDHPTAASTPYPSTSTQFNPEDTACIIYPPVVSDTSLTKSNLRRAKKFPRRGVLRTLLPKPYRKDPPNIVHIRVMPQNIEEEEDEELVDDPLQVNSEEFSDNELVEKMDKKNNENNDALDTEETASNNKKNVSQPDNLNAETPKVPRPKLKKNISRSTPRRNSHVRALSFNTPLKPVENRKSNTSPKMPKIRFSPGRSKINSVKRSSLFSPKKPLNLSPLLEVEERQELSGRMAKRSKKFFSPLSKVPIATRSPAPKLSSAWKEVNDVVIPTKPVWDKSLREFDHGEWVDPLPPPKKDSKPKPKEKQSKKSDEESVGETNKKDTPPRRSSRLNGIKDKNAEGSNKKVTIRKNKKQNQLLVINKNKKVSPSKSPIKQKPLNESSESKKSAEEITCAKSETVNSNSENVNNIKIGDGKKYSNTSINLDSDTSNDSHQNLIIDTPVEKPVPSEEKISQPINVLVVDLVLSSNSLPSAGGSAEKKKEKIAIEHQLSEESSFGNISSKSTEVVSKLGLPGKDLASATSTFSIPHLPVLETPMKDIQNLIVPQTPLLDTPLLKTIRQDISVLHEDLLLTPSLPPTPQVQSDRLLSITPTKPVAMNEATEPNFKNIPNCIENDKTGDLSTNKESSGTGNNIVTEYHKVVKSSEVLTSDFTSDDSSEKDSSDDSSDDPPYIDPKYIPKIRTRIVQEDNLKRFKPGRKNITQVVEKGGSKPVAQSQDNISKLRNTILEDEMKSLNYKPPKTPLKKPASKKPTNNSSHSEGHSPTKSSETIKNNTGLIKETKHETSKVSPNTQKNKFPRVNIRKRNRTEQSTLKVSLLKQERKEMFGEGYTTSSDTSSDAEVIVRRNQIVEPKQTKANVVKSPDKKTKVVKEDTIKIKSVLSERTHKVQVIAEDSSESSLEPIIENSPKVVTELCPSKELTKGIQEKLPMSVDGITSTSSEISPSFIEKNSNSVTSSGICPAPLIGNNPSIDNEKYTNSEELHKGKQEELFKICDPQTSSETGKNSEKASLIENNLKTVVEQYNAKELPKEKQENLPMTIDTIGLTNTGQSSETTLNETKKSTAPSFDDDNASSNYNPNDLQPTQTEKNNTSYNAAKNIKLSDVTDTLSLSCDSSLFDTNEVVKSKVINNHPDRSYEEEENHIVIVSTSQNHPTRALRTSEFDPNHTEVYDTEDNTVTLSFSKIFLHLTPNLPKKKIKPIPVKPEVFQQFKGDFDSKARSHHEGVWKKVADVDIEEVNSSKNSSDNTINFMSTEHSPFCNRSDKAEKELSKATLTSTRQEVDFPDKSTPQMTSSLIGSAKNKNDMLSKSYSSPVSTLGCSDRSKENTPNTSYKSPSSSDRSGEPLVKQNYRSRENVKPDRRQFDNDKDSRKRDYKPTPNTRYRSTNSSSSNRSAEASMKSHRRSDENLKTGDWKYEEKKNDYHSDKRDNLDNRRQSREKTDRLSRYQLDRRKERDEYVRRRESPLQKSNEVYDHRERHYSRYKEDLRDYLERRPYSSRNHSRREEHTSYDSKRQDLEHHSDRFSRTEVRRSFGARSKVTWKDLDGDDEPSKEQNDNRGHSSKPAKMLDPRANEVVRYSMERASSSDGSESLMDYAVTSSSRKSRSVRVASNNVTKSEETKVSKRKTCDDEPSMEQAQEEKRIRLAKEADIREAKSVLKHKMADMLNALHPVQQRKTTSIEDNSNEASS